MELKIEYLPITELKPYENNARKHAEADVEAIKKSIEEFGFNDPIGIWHDIIVEGHGRLLAAQELEMAEVPVIRLDHMTDEERRAYALAHNKTAELSEWDFATLDEELESLAEFDIDMSDFGFSVSDFEDLDFDQNTENIYTSKVDIPQYEPSGQDVSIDDCLDTEKYKSLCDTIKQSGVSEEEKDFLMKAAARHLQFSYKKIADYYASNASKEMQKLMEDSALVIIDYNDAIKNGYAVLRKTVTDLMQEDGYEA